jgi:hypothetical protein
MIPPQRGQTTPHNTCARTHVRVQKTQQRWWSPCTRRRRRRRAVESELPLDENDERLPTSYQLSRTSSRMKKIQESHTITDRVSPPRRWGRWQLPSNYQLSLKFLMDENEHRPPSSCSLGSSSQTKLWWKPKMTSCTVGWASYILYIKAIVVSVCLCGQCLKTSFTHCSFLVELP